MAKLTKPVVDAAAVREKDYFIWDDELPGFGLRIFASGKRSYLIQYRAAGRTRRYTIGLHGIWTAETARQEAKVQLRGDANYAIKELRKDLQELIDKAVPDSVFEANLSEVRYSPRSGNGHIRYLLITLEDYAQWYEGGANGVPKCKDKTRVFDFSNTTLEHIYPRSAKGSEKVEDLEKNKHALGNLTIFGPNDNDAAVNKSFAEKRPVLQSSNLKLNRDIGAHADWTADRVEQRTQSLVNMALKVFVP